MSLPIQVPLNSKPTFATPLQHLQRRLSLLLAGLLIVTLIFIGIIVSYVLLNPPESGLLVGAGIFLGGIGAVWLVGYKLKQYLLQPLKEAQAELAEVEQNSLNLPLKTFQVETDIKQREHELTTRQAAGAIEHAHLFERLEEERSLLAQRVQERTAELSRANAELARAARLKDEFLMGMSHELRTPLNTILGSAEILQAGVFGPLNERQLKFSKNIGESGTLLLTLINDILDLSKIEAGKLDLEFGPVSIEGVCEASQRMVKQLAHTKQLQVHQTINSPGMVMQADERRLKQMLVDLLSNAVKFTPEGGQIGLEVVADEVEETVHFTVWDTGIGIALEDMSRLFQPFIQLDSRLARQYAGTGLGLSLVVRMAELHGGGVSLESQVDQGSRFTISLPWAMPDQAAEPVGKSGPEVSLPGAALAKNGKPYRILLADDNEHNINLFQKYLQTTGYQVIVARNGQEAIERTREDNPDLILMDIQMPGLDGLEATRRLRADVAGASIPIITVTTLAMPGDRERCLAAGANDYLSKPIRLEKLLKTIRAYL